MKISVLLCLPDCVLLPWSGRGTPTPGAHVCHRCKVDVPSRAGGRDKSERRVSCPSSSELVCQEPSLESPPGGLLPPCPYRLGDTVLHVTTMQVPPVPRRWATTHLCLPGSDFCGHSCRLLPLHMACSRFVHVPPVSLLHSFGCSVRSHCVNKSHSLCLFTCQLMHIG